MKYTGLFFFLCIFHFKSIASVTKQLFFSVGLVTPKMKVKLNT